MLPLIVGALEDKSGDTVEEAEASDDVAEVIEATVDAEVISDADAGAETKPETEQTK
jgi:hypothetical protein